MATAKKNSKASANLAALGANLAEDDDPGLGDAPKIAPERRVRIQLEDNGDIPPGGQFFQCGGSDENGNRFLHSYLLKPGVPATVPLDLIEILNNAVGSTPVLDDAKSVIGYRDVLRFPYRVLAQEGSARA